MRLSRLYSNKPEIISPIDFVHGLNVILAEIRLPENKKRNTHNLGKTLLGRLIDFCLISRKSDEHFLFKRYDLFKDFVFFIEIEVVEGSYVTIRRAVENATKFSFMIHNEKAQDYNQLPVSEWDHSDVPYEKAKQLLDGILDLRSLKSWSYRNVLGYILRTQKDFGDAFQLSKHKGPHATWKPFLAHILGFNSDLVEELYNKEEQLNDKEAIAKAIFNDISDETININKIDGILSIKLNDAEEKQNQLDSFDFRTSDKEKTKTLVDNIDIRVSELNSERYYLNKNKKKIEDTLKEGTVLFNPNEAERIFKEAGVLFSGQIKRNLDQLIEFNKAITEERRVYLIEEITEIKDRLKNINSEINMLGKQRSETLAFLSDSDSFNKYKLMSNEMSLLKADIMILEKKRENLVKLQKCRNEIRTLTEEREKLISSVEEDVDMNSSPKADSLFSSIRQYFNEIIMKVLDRNAILSVNVNKEGHVDFKAEFLDESGNKTSADQGHSHQKLLCIAFDMAVARAHHNDQFPHFIFHDGVLESFDNRIKENLVELIREYSSYGLQHIITAIDSDLWSQTSDIFNKSEIILTLHDETEKGRLFKMEAW